MEKKEKPKIEEEKEVLSPEMIEFKKAQILQMEVQNEEIDLEIDNLQKILRSNLPFKKIEVRIIGLEQQKKQNEGNLQVLKSQIKLNN